MACFKGRNCSDLFPKTHDLDVRLYFYGKAFSNLGSIVENLWAPAFLGTDSYEVYDKET